MRITLKIFFVFLFLDYLLSGQRLPMHIGMAWAWLCWC